MITQDKIKTYVEVQNELDTFTQKLIDKLSKLQYHQYHQNYCYSCLDHAYINDDEVAIDTFDYFRGERDSMFIYVPLDVFISNDIDNYVKQIQDKIDREYDELLNQQKYTTEEKEREEYERLKQKYEKESKSNL